MTWLGTIMLGVGLLSCLMSVSEVVRLWRLRSLRVLPIDAEQRALEHRAGAIMFGVCGVCLSALGPVLL